MNLPAIARNARDLIFSITDSIEVVGTYYHVVGGAYDVTSGTTANTTTTFPASARTGVFDQRMVDGDRIRAGDKKLFFKTSEVPVMPGADDYFVDSLGVRWDLLQIGTEPTDSLLILRGRAHAK